MYAEIVVDISSDSVNRLFDYVVPDDTSIGSRVRVSFGRQKLVGYVLNLKEKSSYDTTKLKAVDAVIDKIPMIKSEMVELCKFMTKHFFLRYSDVFKLMLPNSIRQNKQKDLFDVFVSLDKEITNENLQEYISKRSKTQIKIAEYLLDKSEVNIKKLIELFDRNAIKSMLEKGFLTKREVKVNRILERWEENDKKVTLNDEQQNAVNEIINSNETFLLQGVTGSGKTEVYMHVIANALKQGKNAIILVPEISLTPQMLARFTARFGDTVAMLHSGLSEGEKYDEWQKIYDGNAHVILGARSAIFAPVENLGVIVIDEEHDSSYISTSNPRYDTFTVAKFRAEANNCPLVMGSATPKIDSFNLAKKGEIRLLKLTKRVKDIQMPKIEIVDMINEVYDGNTSPFSRMMLAEIKKSIEHKKQAMIFINRRGFASFVMCRECGYIAKCSDCDVPLVYHKEDNELKCHFCNKRYRALTNCPNCNSTYIKYGAVGTQRVVDELKDIFPEIPIFRMDNDTTRGKNAHAKILHDFANVKPSILVGTQMIAKGHDFPSVEMVGIIDADVSLYNGDFRSTETTYQLITQVAGRAGRADSNGLVVLQTYSPKHYVYRFAQNYDYDGFFDKEINLRETTKFPPFSTIMRILVSSESKDLALETTKQIYESAIEIKKKYPKNILYLQAMPSPVKRIQNKFRFQVLVRYFENEEISCELFKISDIIKKNVSIFVEMNPLNMR